MLKKTLSLMLAVLMLASVTFVSAASFSDICNLAIKSSILSGNNLILNFSYPRPPFFIKVLFTVAFLRRKL